MADSHGRRLWRDRGGVPASPSPAAPPLVTLALPTRNAPERLERILDQAQRQTYPALEILVSDNGSSTDEAVRLAQERARLDPRIRVYRQERNIGYAGNHQFLVDQARGRYFVWWHDDDAFPDDYIARCVAVLEADAAVVLCSGACDRHLEGRFDRSYEPIDQRGQTTYQRLRMLLPDGFSYHWRYEYLQYGLFRREAMQHRFSADFKAEYCHLFALAGRGALVSLAELRFIKNTTYSQLLNHASGGYRRRRWLLRPFASISPTSLQQCTPTFLRMLWMILRTPGLGAGERLRLLWNAWYCFWHVPIREETLRWRGLLAQRGR
ncbi:MAG: glycosyltransferase family 2 protein [Synechococcaceae cyanobacterium]|nr:glycosyltransferase family 2 protein [Synechococcaceae cyanobacterium]